MVPLPCPWSGWIASCLGLSTKSWSCWCVMFGKNVSYFTPGSLYIILQSISSPRLGLPGLLLPGSSETSVLDYIHWTWAYHCSVFFLILSGALSDTSVWNTLSCRVTWIQSHSHPWYLTQYSVYKDAIKPLLVSCRDSAASEKQSGAF